MLLFERVLERALHRAHLRMICLLKPRHAARHRPIELRLGWGQWLACILLALDREGIAVFDDPGAALDRKTDKRCGEALVVEFLFPHIAHAAGTEPRRRHEEWNDRPLGWIAPDAKPGEEIIKQRNRHAAHNGEEADIVPDGLLGLLDLARRRHEAFRPSHRDSETFVGVECARGARLVAIASCLDDFGIAAA